jgi:hypothetical protein
MKARFFSLIRILCLLILSVSCGGYHFTTNNNPLIGYDIKSIAVPMFINRSNIPELAAPMTKEITLTLNDYDGLRVFSGDNKNADAVLIGIIESKDLINDTLKTSQYLFTDNTVKSSVGERSPFYYPIESTYTLTFRVILIKRPSKQDLEMITSDLGKFMKANPKVVLMDQFDLTSTFSRVVAESTTPDSAGEVNFTKNKGVLEKNLQETSVRAAQNFKQVVLNAF